MKAVPKLLEMLALRGTILAADAMHCQRDTAAQIVEHCGEYAFAVKSNQSALYDDVKNLLRGLGVRSRRPRHPG
jgi:predicted transposase YbfD/YdcC